MSGSIHDWWRSRLEGGTQLEDQRTAKHAGHLVDGPRGWKERISTDALYEDYVRWATRASGNAPQIGKQAFMSQFARLSGATRGRTRRHPGRTERPGTLAYVSLFNNLEWHKEWFEHPSVRARDT